jgi:Pentapeptide repeats (8 copies)
MSQNLSYCDLKNKSFRGQNLSGHNFTGADVSGVDFTGTTLKNADFTDAKAGLPKLFLIRLLLITILLSFLSGFIAAYAGAVLGNLFNTINSNNLSIGIFALTGLILFVVSSLRKGFTNQLGIISLIIASSIVLIVAITPNEDVAARTAISSLAFGGSIAGVVSLTTAISSSSKSRSCTSIAILGIIAGTYLAFPWRIMVPLTSLASP